MNTYVYFARRKGRVKIGFSADPMRRARSLGAKLICCFLGTREDERKAHKRFAAIRGRGEWFQYVEEIDIYLQSRAWQRATPRYKDQKFIAYIPLDEESLDRVRRCGKIERRPPRMQLHWMVMKYKGEAGCQKAIARSDERTRR